MDDLMLEARLDEFTTLKVAPVDSETYAELVEDDTLGGSGGYFVVRSSTSENRPRFEILAKAASFDAAGTIFDMIVGSARQRQYA
ncbi:MAG: hypothetical protein AAFQ68_21040 [Bacteroidota bacterium]